MEKQVCLICRDRGMCNAVAQICHRAGYQTRQAITVQGEDTLNTPQDLQTCDLVVIDTAVFGEGEADQCRSACQVLRGWTAAHPGLPLVFLSSVAQKRTLHAIRTDIVRCVAKPFVAQEFEDAMQMFLAERTSRHNYHTTQVTPEEEPIYISIQTT